MNFITSSDSESWPSLYPSNTSIFISALGTTARQAGSFAAQRKIDYDLNVALAKAAKARGVQTYILISTSGAHPDSRIPYSKMKGELDEAVKKLGFRRTVILKPGLLVGTREDSRPGEFMAGKVAGWLGSWSEGWAQRAEIVARAAVKAALEEGEGIRVLDQREIVKLGGW